MNKLIILFVGFLLAFTSCDRILGEQILSPNDLNNLLQRPEKNPETKSSVLSVSMDTANDKTAKLPYQLAGTTTGYLAAIALQTQDSVIIDSITVDVSADKPGNIFSDLLLTDGQGNLLAMNPNVRAKTVFKGLGKISGKTIFFLKASLNAIGRDQVGMIDDSASFQIGGVSARCAENKKLTLKIVYENDSALTKTKPSATIKIVAARISSVNLIDSDPSFAVSPAISGAGWYNATIIRIATDASNNTDDAGAPAQILLDKISLNIRNNPATVIDQVRLGRVRDSGIGFLSPIPPTIADFDMITAADSTDRKIGPGKSADFLVQIHVSALDKNSPNWFQVSLDNLNGNDVSANFFWRDGNDALLKYSLKLASDNLAGTKISEQ
jgi:hypothetical protein